MSMRDIKQPQKNNITILKIAVFMTLMIIGFIAFISSIKHAGAVTLKAESLITGDHITVGDVFTGLNANKDYILAPAPKPGQDLIWNASTLNRIARAFDLPWTPQNGLTQLKIRRLASVVTPFDVKENMKKELSKYGLNKDSFELSIESLPQDGIILPFGADTSFRFDNLRYDAGQKLVRATFVSPAKGTPNKTIPMHAYVVDVENVPVLNKRMRRGEIIRASDIKYIKVRSTSLTHDTLLNAEEIIGTTPRASINTASPIRHFDLQMPKIVGRGDTVTMVYNNGRIHLETVGKALQGGAKGDIIRVANGASNKTIEAEITGERTVTVR